MTAYTYRVEHREDAGLPTTRIWRDHINGSAQLELGRIPNNHLENASTANFVIAALNAHERAGRPQFGQVDQYRVNRLLRGNLVYQVMQARSTHAIFETWTEEVAREVMIALSWYQAVQLDLLPAPQVLNPRPLDNVSPEDAKASTSDVKVVGPADVWKVISKASSASQGWMKSMKGMQVPGGVLVQVTTQQRNPDGSFVIAEALTFVPQARLTKSGDMSVAWKLEHV